MESRARLLVIDDDPDFVESIQAILEGAGYRVDVAHNPRDGLAALKGKPYDLLLLDVLMGRGAEGVLLARKIKKDPRLSHLPVLIITGVREQIAFLFPGESLDPRIFPVDALVEKPVEPRLLLDRVAALLPTGARIRQAG